MTIKQLIFKFTYQSIAFIVGTPVFMLSLYLMTRNAHASVDTMMISTVFSFLIAVFVGTVLRDTAQVIMQVFPIYKEVFNEEDVVQLDTTEYVHENFEDWFEDFKDEAEDPMSWSPEKWAKAAWEAARETE
jgi:hypothetical protein